MHYKHECSMKLIVILSLGSTRHYTKHEGPYSQLFASCAVSYDAANLTASFPAFFIATVHDSRSVLPKFLCVNVVCCAAAEPVMSREG